MKKLYKITEGRVVYKRILNELKKFFEVRPISFLEEDFNRIQNNFNPETHLVSYDLVGTNLILSFRYFFRNGRVSEIMFEENPYGEISSTHYTETGLDETLNEICKNFGINLREMNLVIS